MTNTYIDPVQFTNLVKEFSLNDHDTEQLLLDFNKLLHTLESSDLLMHEVIFHAQGLPYQLPDNPDASVEYGMILYWIQHPPELLEKIIKDIGIPQWFWEMFKSAAPKPTVTDKQYTFLLDRIYKHNGIVAPDGTILGKSQYEQLDEKWLYAFANYLLNLTPLADIAPFGKTPYCEAMQAGQHDKVRIMIIGDWGTGQYNEGGGYDPAQEIIDRVSVLKPDYLIHLGDVYYAGTELRLPPFEEQQNFLNLWPKLPEKHSFTLNSNHEMYGGANGYFNIALGRCPKKDTPFSHQKGTSYFALSFGDWVIVGLDAAYHDPSSLYMQGGLGDQKKYPHQYSFLKQVTTNAKKVLLLTHQTGMNTKGDTALQLWQDISGIIKPDLWYWGHEHLGVVYNEQSYLGKHQVKARCVGHSAIPFGDAWELPEQDGVEWYAHTPAGITNKSNLMKNGFALLTLRLDGSVTEEIYETGNEHPVWTG